MERKEALTLGLKYYNTGKPCRRGHISDRLTSKSECLICKSSRDIEYKQIHKDEINLKNIVYRNDNKPKKKIADALYRENHKDDLREYRLKRRIEHPEKIIEQNKKTLEWQKNNPEKCRIRNRKWEINNPAKAKAKCARRRAKQLGCYPVWADNLKILSIYDECQYLNTTHTQQYEVDHVIPMGGKNITGLHVDQNLQIITLEANRAKSNKYEII